MALTSDDHQLTFKFAVENVIVMEPVTQAIANFGLNWAAMRSLCVDSGA